MSALPVVSLKEWNEADHPRAPAGSEEGGQFVSVEGAVNAFASQPRYSMLGEEKATGLAIKTNLKVVEGAAEVREKFSSAAGLAYDDLPITSVSASLLHDTQGGLFRSKVMEMAGNFLPDTMTPLSVVRYKGKLYVMDGHHRAAVAAKFGKKVPVKIFDADV